MKLFYTVMFFSLLAFAAFARGESVLARVTSYWAGEGLNTPVPADDCAPDIALSIPNEFRTPVRVFSLIGPARRSTPDRRAVAPKAPTLAEARARQLTPRTSPAIL